MIIFIGIFVVVAVLLLFVYSQLGKKEEKKPDTNKKVSENAIKASKNHLESKIREKYTLPLDKSNLFVDLHRFAPSVTINHNGKTIFSGEETEKQYQKYKQEYSLKELCLSIARCFNESEIEKKLDETFPTYFSYIGDDKTGDCGSYTKGYLMKNIPEDNSIFSVLRFISQSYGMFVSLYLAKLYSQFTFKDNNGNDQNNWKIVIDITDDKIVVKQYKKQISKMKKCFDFTWVLTLEYNRRKNKITSWDICLENYNFYENMKENDKKRFEKILDKLQLKPKQD